MTLSRHLDRRLEAAVGTVGPAIRFAHLGWILAGCLTVVPIVRAVRRRADRDGRTGEGGARRADPDENESSGDDVDPERTTPTRARALARRLLRASTAG